MQDFTRFTSLALLSAALFAHSAHAALRDKQIDAAKLCTSQFMSNERMHGIPTHLLAAISSTESGRWNETLGMVLPWPWTINSEGKGYYFDTKAEAVAKAKSLQRQGVKSIDIGCMQVNLKHHPNAFTSIEQAFEPQHNVAYAARFLRGNYDDTGSWTSATAAYHSRTPRYGNVYLSRIKKSWNGIVAKIQEARAKRGMEPGRYSLASSDADAKVMATLKGEFDKVRDMAPLSASNRQPQLSASKSMRVIEVKERTASDVMVIRPVSAKTSETTLTDGVTTASWSGRSTSPESFFVVNRKAGMSPAGTVAKTTQPAGAKPRSVFVD